MINNYLLYLAYLTQKLEKFFDNQAPYIFCKKGCSKCCENGEYPFSKLSDEKRKIVEENIRRIKKEKAEFNGETFSYACPFLINNECSVYEFRGIICRSFGLMSINDKGASKIPFCAFEGLNYSNVLEPETKIISSEKYKKLGNVNEPLAFNVSYKFLTSDEMAKNFSINFGDKKSLIDWF